MTRRALSVGLWALVFPATPAPGLLRSKAEVRQLECVPLDPQAAAHSHPGMVRPPAPRGEFGERQTVRCAAFWLDAGLRAPQTEALLRRLDREAQALALRAQSALPGPRTWLVEAHHADPQVAAKLRFATQARLLSDQSAPVSDRQPRWTPTDVAVLTRLPPDRAFPAACKRAHDRGDLGHDDALLSIFVLDARDTGLHGGVCVDGRWTWLP